MFDEQAMSIGIAMAKELVERHRSNQSALAEDSRRTLDTVVGYMAWHEKSRCLRLTYPEPVRQILRAAGLSEWS